MTENKEHHLEHVIKTQKEIIEFLINKIALLEEGRTSRFEIPKSWVLEDCLEEGEWIKLSPEDGTPNTIRVEY